MGKAQEHHFEILLVEDNPGDIRLAQEIFSKSRYIKKLNIVHDGEEAHDYLYKIGKYEGKENPHLILLDINLPKKNGFELLSEIKGDPTLRHIPVIMLTSSESDNDIYSSYQNYANCYISKPVDFEQFFNVITNIEKFWFTISKLPEH